MPRLPMYVVTGTWPKRAFISKESKAKQSKIKQASKQASNRPSDSDSDSSLNSLGLRPLHVQQIGAEREREGKTRHSLDDLHPAPTYPIHLPQNPVRSSISTTPIRPVTETLIHDRALQTHAVHLAADRGGAAGIHAVIRRVRQILVLEGGVGAPADAAPLVADAPGAPGLHRHVARELGDQGSAGGFGGLVRIGAGFFRPALLWGGVGGGGGGGGAGVCGDAGGGGERLALEAEEGLADVRGAGGVGVQLDQALVWSVRIRRRDGHKQTLLHLVAGDFDIVGISVHGERGVQVNEVTVLTLGGGGFGQTSKDLKRLQIVQ
jgi:hypothetical protein